MTLEEIKFYVLVCIGIWVVVKVSKGGTRTIHQSSSERTATNYMVKTIQDNDGKVVKHIKEDSGQTWEVKTPDGETSYYTTINTEDDNL